MIKQTTYLRDGGARTHKDSTLSGSDGRASLSLRVCCVWLTPLWFWFLWRTMRCGYVHRNVLSSIGQWERWHAHRRLVFGLFFHTQSLGKKELTRHGPVSLLTRPVISDRWRETREWITPPYLHKVLNGRWKDRGYLEQTTLPAPNSWRAWRTAYRAEAWHDFGSKSKESAFYLSFVFTVQTLLFLSLWDQNWNKDAGWIANTRP